MLVAVAGPSAEGLDLPVWDTRGCRSGGGPYPEGVRGIVAWWDSTASSEVLDQVVEPVVGEDGSGQEWTVLGRGCGSEVVECRHCTQEPSPEGVRQMVGPARKGFVLGHLIWIRYPSGILWRSLCSSAMISLLRRKPKKATNIAAQRVRWSV